LKKSLKYWLKPCWFLLTNVGISYYDAFGFHNYEFKIKTAYIVFCYQHELYYATSEINFNYAKFFKPVRFYLDIDKE